MSWSGVKGGCSCKGLARILFEELEKGTGAMMQPRPWGYFFKGLIGTSQNLQQRWFGVDPSQLSNGWGFYLLGVKR
eukprot:5414121-Ditylum_brightwellii.AAC.1